MTGGGIVSQGTVIHGEVRGNDIDFIVIRGTADGGNNQGIALGSTGIVESDSSLTLIGSAAGTGEAIFQSGISGGIFSNGSSNLSILSTSGDIDIGNLTIANSSGSMISLTNPADDFVTLGQLNIAGSLSVVGSDGNNTITFTDDSYNHALITIDGGIGNDLVDFSNITTGPVNFLSSSASNVENVVGSQDSNDTLTGSAGNDVFTINGMNSGNHGSLVFADFENLNGAAGNDAFTFLPGGDLDGTVNGGSGMADLLFIDNRTDPISRNYIVTDGQIIGSQYDFANIEMIDIGAGNGSDTVVTDFFPAFSQTLNGGNGTDSVTFSSNANNGSSPYTSSDGQAVTIADFETVSFQNSGSTQQPTGLTNSNQSNGDSGAILQNETNTVGSDTPGNRDDGNNMVNNFNEEDRNSSSSDGIRIMVDADGDGVDDDTGAFLAADGNPLPSAQNRKPGEPFLLVNPDGAILINDGPPPPPPVLTELVGSITPAAESELDEALGGPGVAGLIDSDGPKTIDGGSDVPAAEISILLGSNLTDEAGDELGSALSE